MTDEIKITRRIALEKMYEFYEIEWKTDDGTPEQFAYVLEAIEDRVADVRELMGKPLS